MHSLTTELANIPISPEYRGLARSLMQRCKAAHSLHSERINALTGLIEQRNAKHPLRSIPADLVQCIVRSWRDATDPFRLAFSTSITRSKGSVVECRIANQGLIHPQWEENSEPNLILAFVGLTISKASAQITVRAQHAFSAHSLMRFYERSGLKQDADAISAMASVLVFDPTDVRLGDEVALQGWRGVVKQRATPQGYLKLWCARTWL